MPEVHDLNHAFVTTNTVVNEIRFAQNASNIRTLPIWRSKFWKIRQRLRAIDQIVAESFRGCRIILRNEVNNLLQLLERLGERKLFSSPSTDFLADAFEGNAFTGIKFGHGFIESRKQCGLLRVGHDRLFFGLKPRSER